MLSPAGLALPRCQHAISLCFPGEVQMGRPRIRDLPLPAFPWRDPHPEPCWIEGREGGGLSLRVVLGWDLGSVSFQLRSQDPHHGDYGGTGAFAKPVSLGKRGDKGPGDRLPGPKG